MNKNDDFDESFEIDDESTTQATVEDVKDYVRSKEFQELLNKGAEEKAKAKDEIIPSFKSTKTEFIDYMVSGSGEKDKDEIKVLKKKFGKVYGKLVDFKHDQNGTFDIIENSKMDKLANNVATLIKYLNFIGDDTFTKYLESYGIFIDNDNTVKLTDEFKSLNKDTASNMKDMLDEGDSYKCDLDSVTDKIKTVIFTDGVPEELQYSKTNKCGIKPAAFIKLSTAVAVKKSKSEEKLTKYLDNITENSIFAVAREELIQEGIEQIKE